VQAAVLAIEAVRRATENRPVGRLIVVPNRVANVVTTSIGTSINKPGPA
jgi:hypothetical protein